LPGITGSILLGVQATFPKTLPGVIDGAITADRDYVNRSYNVFYAGDYIASVPSNFCEITIPLRGDMYLRAIALFQKTIREYSARTGNYLPGPFNVRLTHGTDAHLGRNEDY